MADARMALRFHVGSSLPKELFASSLISMQQYSATIGYIDTVWLRDKDCSLRILQLRVLASIGRGDWDDAESVLRLALAKSKEDPLSLTLAAFQADRRLEATEALSLLEQAYATDATCPLTLANLSLQLALKRDRSRDDEERAIKLADKLCAMSVYTNPSHLLHFAAIQSMCGRTDPAKKSFLAYQAARSFQRVSGVTDDHQSLDPIVDDLKSKRLTIIAD
jgi:hypothetical protein